VIPFKQQGEAVVGVITLPDGRAGRVVLVGPRDHPKGAMLVVSTGAASSDVVPLSTALPLLSAQQIIEIVCMQERAFGTTGLPAPELAS
jgi:hypothetical protein